MCVSKSSRNRKTKRKERNLCQQIILLGEDVVSDTLQVGILQVGIQVDLHNTKAYGCLELLFGGSRATMEHLI